MLLFVSKLEYFLFLKKLFYIFPIILSSPPPLFLLLIRSGPL